MAEPKKSWAEKFFDQGGKSKTGSGNDPLECLTREDLIELDISYCHASPGHWEYEETPIKEKRKVTGIKMEILDSTGAVICEDIQTDQLDNSYTFIHFGRKVYPHLSRILHAHFDEYPYLHADYPRAKQLMEILKATYEKLPHGPWDKLHTGKPEETKYIYLKTAPDGELVCTMHTSLTGKHQQSMYNADFIRHFYFLFPRLEIMLEEYALKFNQPVS